MDNFDFDINNYSINDIESFLKLKKKYTISDLELNVVKMRTQLLNSSNIDKKYKRDLILFIDQAQKILVNAKFNDESLKPTTISKNDPIDKSKFPYQNPSLSYLREGDLITRENLQFIHTKSEDFVPGTLNPLNTRTLTKCLTIDARFRENILNTQSSDFTIQLPFKLSKVVSTELISFELPVQLYGISSNYGNNYFYISIDYVNDYLDSSSNCGDISNNYVDSSGNFIDSSGNIMDASYNYLDNIIILHQSAKQLIVIPDGNYSSQDLLNTINMELLKCGGIFSKIIFCLHMTDKGSGTNKVIIKPQIDSVNSIKNITLDFSRDIYGNYSNADKTSRFGWNLGFIHKFYTGFVQYVSDGVFEPSSIKYVYLSVEDFNNSTNNVFVSAFDKIVLDTNILARINMNNQIVVSEKKMITEPRKYFGPVDIQRLRIRLLDEYGRIMYMNDTNYSFCLQFKLMYDL